MRGKNILIVEDNKYRIEAFKRRLVGNNVIFVKQSRDGISRSRARDIDVLFNERRGTRHLGGRPWRWSRV